MKTINFSVVEILPSLLNRTKQQTIRPAWEEDKSLKPIADEINKKIIQKIEPKAKLVFNKDKLPHFKVGDKVKLFWKQRSKDNLFCEKCGFALGSCECGVKPTTKKYFNKHLGTAEITEVFKIEIHKYYDGDSKKIVYFILKPKYGTLTKQEEKDLAKRDGFSSTEQMFQTLDKMYDLSTPKQFYVYRWRWQSHK